MRGRTLVNEDGRDTLGSPSLEQRTQAYGRRLLERLQRKRDTWTEGAESRALALLSENDRLRTRALRLVDVLPGLVPERDDALLLDLARELLGPVSRDLPPAVSLPLRAALSGALPPPVFAGLARSAVSRIGRRFIVPAGEEGRALRELRASGRLATFDVLGEAVVGGAQAEAYAARYLDLVGALARDADAGLASPGGVPRLQVSLKLSALTPRFDPADPPGTLRRLRRPLERILDAARRGGVAVTWDVEQYALRDLTWWLFQEVFRPAGAVRGLGRGGDRGPGLPPRCPRPSSTGCWPSPAGGASPSRCAWSRGPTGTTRRSSPGPPAGRPRCAPRSGRRTPSTRPSRGPSWGPGRTCTPPSPATTCAAWPTPPPWPRRSGWSRRRWSTRPSTGWTRPSRAPCGTWDGSPATTSPAATSWGGWPTSCGASWRTPPRWGSCARAGSTSTRTSSWPPRGRSPAPATPAPAPAAGRGRPEGRAVARGSSPWPRRASSWPRSGSASRAALEETRREWGQTVPLRIGGRAGAHLGAARWSPSAPPTPTRQRPVAVVQAADLEATAAAIRAAVAAAPAWAALPAAERAGYLRRAADLLLQRAGHGGRLGGARGGEGAGRGPGRRGRGDRLPALLRRRGRAALPAPGRSRTRRVSRAAARGRLGAHRPRGVVAVIPPWNFPLAIPAGMTAAALAAGNTVLLKPSEETPFVAHLLVQALHQGGRPAGRPDPPARGGGDGGAGPGGEPGRGHGGLHRVAPGGPAHRRGRLRGAPGAGGRQARPGRDGRQERRPRLRRRRPGGGGRRHPHLRLRARRPEVLRRLPRPRPAPPLRSA